MTGRRKTFLFCLIAIAGIGWALTMGQQPVTELFASSWSWVAIAAVAVAAFFVLRAALRSLLDLHAGKTAARKAAAIVDENLPALVRRRAQLVRTDPYGKPLLDGWTSEVSYFLEEHIKPHLTPRELFVLEQERQDAVLAAIHLRVEEESERNPAFLTFSDDMTPNEFETFCAEELRRGGWNARVTLQSRDQGVDVVAEKDDIRVVLQCKLYARPVGNKAVQEIAGARAHERADYGIVVSNSRYTRDAEQLASTNGVLLLHYSDLRKLDAIVGRSPSAHDSWYYDDGRKQVGPLSLEDLKQALATLPNRDDVFVWSRRMQDWKVAREVPELNPPRSRTKHR